MLTQGAEIEELKPGSMHMKQWLILNDTVKSVYYNKHPLGHYEIEVKAVEAKHGIKIYK